MSVGITGFKAKLTFDSVSFDNAVMVALGGIEYDSAEVTTLGQQSGTNTPDPIRRYIPTLAKQTPLKITTLYTKADYSTVTTKAGQRGKAFTLTAPDDTGGTGTGMTATGTGYISKVDDLEFTKDGLVEIKFEIMPDSKITVS